MKRNKPIRRRVPPRPCGCREVREVARESARNVRPHEREAVARQMLAYLKAR